MAFDQADPVLEREPEWSEILSCIRAAGAGGGRVLMLEGPAGIGKTALLRAACEQGRRAGMATLTARAGELESGLPWGVVRDLFEPELAAASKDERRAMLSDAAGLADIALRPGDARESPPGADLFGAALHGLYWLTSNIAAGRPVLLAIDDAQWADKPSIRWLAYLVARLEGLPVLVLTTVQSGVPASSARSISAIARAGRVLRLSPLSREATASLVRMRLGADTSADLCETCHVATAGNPFLLRCLLEDLCDHGVIPSAVTRATVAGRQSEAMSRAILARVGRLPTVAGELASAIALFGAPCSLGDAAALAGLDEDTAAEAADALAARNMIAESEPLEFVHPIVRTAIYEEIPSHRRVRWHGRAARLLDEREAPTQEIAVHLLAVEPRAEPAVTGILCSAATAALDMGAPESAVQFLTRAMAEPPPAHARAAILRRLGGAEASLHDDHGAAHLRAALSLSSDSRERAEIARELAVPLMHTGHLAETVALLERAADELAPGNRELRLELEADIIGARRLAPALRRAALDRVRALRAAHLKGRTFGERVALAAVALEPDSPDRTAAESVELAQRALGNGRLLAEAGVESPSFWYAASALLLADAPQLARPVLDSARAAARSRGSTVGAALSFGFRALLGYRCGHLVDAEADARQALDIAPSTRWAPRVYALVFLIEILLDRGRPEEAAQALAESGLAGRNDDLLPLLLLRQSRGRLSLALGDADTGLADMRAAAARLEAGAFSAHLWPWRSAHALALAAAGEREDACRLASEELRLTRAFGAAGPLGISLRARGLVERGGADTELLHEAVAVLAGSSAALEHARALLDLGAALRRAGRRTDGVESLREGLDRAHRCGADGLVALARQELGIASAKPRRDALRGRDALTASEFRIAGLAAQGRTNREIAQMLFITLRTVETHLTHAYQKLSIQSRDGLPAALGRT
ncbi:MAG: transcriptional regulator, LuxR family [Solirubrobacterales bacterium]|nr:transcriptional regulator, LuxR family [Solirubrobacterales bacterium]